MSSSPKYKYKLTIAYDGTNYSGWQVQPNALSIQTLLQKSLTTVLKNPTHATGSGRTDSGVHALEQVAHFTHNGSIDCSKLLTSLNGLLPLDIRILSLEQTDDDFHARYSATGKIYRYHINPTRIQLPFQRLYSYHLPFPIDLKLLNAATKLFVGTHDFTSFSNQAHLGSASRNPVRTIKRIDLIENKNERILEFEADGFLYKMVRNITGTLLDVARGKIQLDRIPNIFDEKNRSFAGTSAPAHGLFLVKVKYEALPLQSK